MNTMMKTAKKMMGILAAVIAAQAASATTLPVTLGTADYSCLDFRTGGFDNNSPVTFYVDSMVATQFPRELNNSWYTQQVAGLNLSTQTASAGFLMMLHIADTDGDKAPLNLNVAVIRGGATVTAGVYSVCERSSALVYLTNGLVQAGTNTVRYRYAGGAAWMQWDQIRLESPVFLTTNAALGANDGVTTGFGTDGNRFEANYVVGHMTNSRFGQELNTSWWTNQNLYFFLTSTGASCGMRLTLDACNNAQPPPTVQVQIETGSGMVNVTNVMVSTTNRPVITIPPAQLRAGLNRIQLNCTSGAWLQWDQVLLEAIPPHALVIGASPAPHGSPAPLGYGTTFVSPGAVITNRVNSPADSAGGTQYVCSGWTRTGSSPGSGTGTQVVFTVTNNTTLTWNWSNQYYLTTAVIGSGTVSPLSAWYSSNAAVAIQAFPAPGCTFAGWTGSTNGCAMSGNTITAAMNCARSITANFAGASLGPRISVSLNGTWQLEPTATTNLPASWNYSVSVPGIVPNASPALAWTNYNYFWHRNVFTLSATQQRARASVRIAKALYGSEVWLNGAPLGGYVGCFSSHEYAATNLNYGGTNTLIVRVGRHTTLSTNSTFTLDGEKAEFQPGIVDDMSLILSGDARTKDVLVVPFPTNNLAVASLAVMNLQNSNKTVTVSAQVLTKASNAPVTAVVQTNLTLAAGETRRIAMTLAFTNAVRVWSPEDPFLYELSNSVAEAGTPRDSHRVTFGMREFKAVGKDFYLNGKKRLMKGSNIAFYRMMDNPEYGTRPWNPAWIDNAMGVIPTNYNLRYFRIHLGPMYGYWYDVADRAGLLLEDEWSFWGNAGGTTNQIVEEFTQWMYDSGNHPSIVMYNAINEPRYDDTNALPMIHFLENTLAPQLKAMNPTKVWAANDYSERHHYFYSYLGVMGYPLLLDEINAESKPVVLNEYNWLWHYNDGQPSLITEWVMGRWTDANKSNPANYAGFLQMQADHVVEVSELWRRMELDVIAPFAYLSGGRTADWFYEFTNMTAQPILTALKSTFAPVGVSLDLWDRHFAPGQTSSVSAYVFNDLDTARTGTLTCTFVTTNDALVSTVGTYTVTVSAVSSRVQTVNCTYPSSTGTYHLKGALTVNGSTSTSRKLVHVVPAPVIPGNLSGAKIMVYDPDREITDYLRSLGLNATNYTSATLTNQDILVLGEGALTDPFYTSRRAEITRFAKAGRSVIVQEPSYTIPKFDTVELPVLDDASVLSKGMYYRANESYVFKQNKPFGLWTNIADEHLKMFNGGYGGEMLSAFDDIPQQFASIQASAGEYKQLWGDPYRAAPALLECVDSNAVIVYSRIQVRGRLLGLASPGAELFPRRVDRVAQQYLLNLISTYLNTATNRQRIAGVATNDSLFLKNPLATSVYNNDGYATADNAIDDNTESHWTSEDSDPQWLRVEFGSIQRFSRVKVSWHYNYGKSWSLQASDDENNWTTVYSTTNCTGGTNNVVLSSPVAAKYLRILCTERGISGGTYAIKDFKVYDEPNTSLGSISFNQPMYSGTSGVAVLSVTDADRAGQGTVSVTIRSSVDTNGISMTLKAIATNSSTFTSAAQGTNLSFSEASSGTARIRVGEGSLVTLAYADPSPVGTQKTAVIWYTGRTSENLAYARKTTALSGQTDNPGNKATDNNYYTRWSSDFSDPQWVQVDLGQTLNGTTVYSSFEAREFSPTETRTMGLDIPSTIPVGGGYRIRASVVVVASGAATVAEETPADIYVAAGRPSFRITSYPRTILRGTKVPVVLTWTNVPTDGRYELAVQLNNWGVTPVVYSEKKTAAFPSSANSYTVDVDVASDTTASRGGRFIAAFISVANGWGDVLAGEWSLEDVEIAENPYLPVVRIASYPTTVYKGDCVDVYVSWTNIPANGSYKLLVQLENPSNGLLVTTEITNPAAYAAGYPVSICVGETSNSLGGRFIAAFISSTSGWANTLAAYYGNTDVQVSDSVNGNLIAFHTTGAITLDGLLNEADWATAQSATIMTSTNTDAGVYIGRVLWDEEYLYFAGTATDQQLETADLPWNGDNMGISMLVAGGSLYKSRVDLGGTGEGSGIGLVRAQRVSASSTESAEFAATNAMDGNEYTRWASATGSDDEWFSVDLGRAKEFRKVTLIWESAYADRYLIQISHDGIKWVTVFTENAGNGGTDEINLGTQTARYVRMRGVHRALPQYGYSLYEMRVTTVHSVYTWIGTTNNNSNTDTSWTVEMRIPLDACGPTATIYDVVRADFTAVDHDNNPGGPITPPTQFYKASWDGDGDANTALKRIRLDWRWTLVDDFGDSVAATNSLGLPTSDGGTCVSNLDLYGEHLISWNSLTDYWYSVLAAGTNVLNAGVADTLTLRVRGGAGHEAFRVQIEDHDSTASVGITNYVPIYTLSQRTDIPLRDFAGIDPAKLKKLTLLFSEIPAGTIWIDDIRMTKHGPVICSVDYNNPSYRRADGLPVYFSGETVNYTVRARNISSNAIYWCRVSAAQEYYQAAGTNHGRGYAMPGNSVAGWTNTSLAGATVTNLQATYTIPYTTAPGIDQTHVVVRNSAGNVIFEKDDAGLWCPPLGAVASSELPGHEAIYVLDEDPATSWISAPTDGEWIYIDFDEPTLFDSVVLEWGDVFACHYRIQISDDGHGWATLYEQNDGVGGRESIVLGAQLARFVRLQCEKRVGEDGYVLFDFRPLLGDSDGDGMPDYWERQYASSRATLTAESDSDGDGMRDAAEYIAGTDPTNTHSVLAMNGGSAGPSADGRYVIEWPSAAGRTYTIHRATSLTDGFAPIASGVTATPPVNTYIDTAPGADQVYYKISAMVGE